MFGSVEVDIPFRATPATVLVTVMVSVVVTFMTMTIVGVMLTVTGDVLMVETYGVAAVLMDRLTRFKRQGEVINRIVRVLRKLLRSGYFLHIRPVCSPSGQPWRGHQIVERSARP